MKTSITFAALILFGLASMPQAKDTQSKKEFKGHVTLMKRDAAPASGDSAGVLQPDSADMSQAGTAGMAKDECDKMHGIWRDGHCVLVRESPTKASTGSSDLQMGTCRTCSGACSSCSPPKCACPDISSSKTTSGTDASSPAPVDTGLSPQPAGTPVKPGYNVKANKKM